MSNGGTKAVVFIFRKLMEHNKAEELLVTVDRSDNINLDWLFDNFIDSPQFYDIIFKFRKESRELIKQNSKFNRYTVVKDKTISNYFCSIDKDNVVNKIKIKTITGEIIDIETLYTDKSIIENKYRDDTVFTSCHLYDDNGIEQSYSFTIDDVLLEKYETKYMGKYKTSTVGTFDSVDLKEIIVREYDTEYKNFIAYHYMDNIMYKIVKHYDCINSTIDIIKIIDEGGGIGYVLD